VASTQVLDERNGRFKAGERAVLRFRFHNRLAPSRYTISATAGDRATSFEAYARAEDVAALIVQAPVATGGVVDLPFRFDLERL
jgi:hypothetical protein